MQSFLNFPFLWGLPRIARGAPIHKADGTVERSNHRPISVLTVLPRLFEKLFYEQLYNHLISNEMLFFVLQQSSFKMLHSVLNCLLKCTTDWYLNRDTEQYTSETFIDLKNPLTPSIMIFYLKSWNSMAREIENLAGFIPTCQTGCNAVR